MSKLTHADKDRMLNELRTKLYDTDAALQAANAQLKALTTPPAVDSIADAQRTLRDHDENTCTKCGGTGKVDLANGEQGTCYRCRGKGYLTARDIRRHDVYELHANIANLLAEGRATRYLSRAEINELPASLKAGKRIVEHNGWLVLI